MLRRRALFSGVQHVSRLCLNLRHHIHDSQIDGSVSEALGAKRFLDYDSRGSRSTILQKTRSHDYARCTNKFNATVSARLDMGENALNVSKDGVV